MVLMHSTFVKVVIGGVMVGITNQNVYGVNVLQLRMGAAARYSSMPTIGGHSH